ncbi:MAG: hypothetical protein C3F17_07245 [Bradyrhizobiaceae bacterium]|nr:MAG: hypothetical protein C3F17_07245 [Bradyrhizobiaceae bacterium]
MPRTPSLAATTAAALLWLAGGASAQQANMSFFITSGNPGNGADFGGIDGADRHCQRLAAAAGAGNRVWRAYLSSTQSGTGNAVHARDRIGTGPWHNARGEMIAASVAELHASNKISKQTALTERGDPVPGRGDTPNQHDILTGTQPDGTAFAGDRDTTCGNWTRSGEGSAVVGHHDRVGLRDDEPSRSWNSSHPSRGCSLDALRATGGAGLIYCFATD